MAEFEANFNSKIDSEVFKQSKPTFKGKVKESSVFHYTSVGGMQGILSEKQLRFTNIKYMNDKKEIAAGIERITKIFDSFQLNSKNFFNLELLNQQYFVCCFSREEDSLPMWNYYTKELNNQGYNIEFHYKKLATSILMQNPILDGCSFSCGMVHYFKDDYENENYSNMIETELELAFAKIISVFEKIQLFGEGKKKEKEKLLHLQKEVEKAEEKIKLKNFQIYNYNGKSNMLEKDFGESSLLFIKKDCFEQEKEFRFVIGVPSELLPKLKEEGIYQFRAQNGILVPYLQLKFSPDTIKGITTSPTIKSDLVELSMEEFVKYCDFKLEDYSKFIKRSKVPVRF